MAVTLNITFQIKLQSFPINAPLNQRRNETKRINSEDFMTERTQRDWK